MKNGRKDKLPSIQETAYPRIKSNLSRKELEEVYTPKTEEIEWACRSARGTVLQLGLLVLLKISQRLGYFIPVTKIPIAIIEHVAKKANIPFPDKSEWDAYGKSRTYYRHYAFVREYRGIRFFDDVARQVMLEAMTGVALIKDEPADLVNVAIEQLIRQHFELPAFSTLAKAARHIRAKSYRELYENIYQMLSVEVRKAIDSLLQTSNQSSYTPWHRLKQDLGSPTLKHLRELVAYHEWLSQLNTGDQVLKDIPVAKINQMAAEAKTLDAARMLEMEPKKRYTLATALLAIQTTKVLDD